MLAHGDLSYPLSNRDLSSIHEAAELPQGRIITNLSHRILVSAEKVHRIVQLQLEGPQPGRVVIIDSNDLS